jgi:ribosomal protein S18 acetylase RimI-like enzyme
MGMMIAIPVLASKARPGARPTNILYDARQILELMDVAFGPNLDREGRHILNQNLAAVYQHGLALRLNQATTGVLPGYVWEEEGQIVGNVSLMRSQADGRYLIANVAVHPDYRRRGIARVMMQEVLRYLQQKQAKTAVLQVETKNEGAIRLYSELGFVVCGETTHWELAMTRLKEISPGDQPAPTIRPLRRHEWRAAFRLDQLVASPNLNWPDPLPPDIYRGGLWRWLNDFFNGRERETWIIADQHDNLIGLAAIFSEWSRPHDLTIRVRPDWQGRLERPLLAKLLRRLRYVRSQEVRLDHPTADQIMNDLLPTANFRARRTLTMMQKNMAE